MAEFKDDNGVEGWPRWSWPAWRERLTCAGISNTLAWRWRWRPARPPPCPSRPGGVIVSLTSYPPRFATLHLTLQSLLTQSFRADEVQLWVAHGDVWLLPDAVVRLLHEGLTIHSCDDIKSYKKLIPALRRRPDAVIVTADDDTYYWRHWLRQLVAARTPGRVEVVCHRMHLMRHAGGRPMPYRDWESDCRATGPSAWHFPVGMGGVLYPPGVFCADVMDSAAFTALCPQADDIWFYWMARLNGASFKRVAGDKLFYSWRGTQDQALWKTNLLMNANDDQLGAMVRRYGFF